MRFETENEAYHNEVELSDFLNSFQFIDLDLSYQSNELKLDNIYKTLTYLKIRND